jgi:hypothetical protein
MEMWKVTIHKHVCSRWIIPATKIKLVAPDSDTARLFALRQVHGQQGLPPWRPLLRVSWPHTTAKRTADAHDLSTPTGCATDDQLDTASHR